MPQLLQLLRRGSVLLLLLLGGSLVVAQRQAARPAAGLPAGLARLLRPRADADPQADIRRLRAARCQWLGDSLSRMLVHSRLAVDFRELQQADSLYYHSLLAWREAGATQRRQQPLEVVELAKELASYHHERGVYDSALLYYQQAIAVFRHAGLDSTQGIQARTLPTGHLWGQGWAIAGGLANAGSAKRHLGDLLGALQYYEQAGTLYQQQQDVPGVIWTRCLVGEAYAEQGNYAQALPAYEQALDTARAYTRRVPMKGSHILTGLVLDYYAPLLLALPQKRAYAGQLAVEAARALQLAYSPRQLRYSTHDAILLAKLQLIPAEVALQTNQPTTARYWLREADRWLTYASKQSQGAARPDADYPEVRAMVLGLWAWQQHASAPGPARRLLAQAAALLDEVHTYNSQTKSRQQLAHYCLAMGEPRQVAPLLWPLLRLHQKSLGPLPLSQVIELLTQAYAGAGRYDSAYVYARKTQGLTDALRATQQFAALTATEARFRTREQVSQIRLLTERSRQQTLRVQLASGGATLLALLLLGAGLAWRTTRRLNRKLATQGHLLQLQATRLEELDAAKNQFFANVSHELRTLLTLMLGPLDGLLTASAAPLPAAVHAPVALAHRHACRLLELVNRILDLTKLQAGRLQLHPTPTDLAPLLRRVVAQCESLAVERGIALVPPAALPAPLCLLLDADKVEQILTNLLINALKHTPTGGAVLVGFAPPDSEGQCMLTVRDTGPGIAASEQTRVFERYYQSPQQQAQGGTGLGLALSRELATLLGGTLTLVSAPGQGAAFTLRFPAPVLPGEGEGQELDEEVADTLPAPPAAPSPRPTTTAGACPRVLVVEDQPDLREYLRQLLEPTYEVLTAADGQEALDLLTGPAAVDLITTDAMMPRLSGNELLACLRATPAQADIPVLMLTARADEGHRLAALTVGVDDYLTKPFVAAELLARVRTLLESYAVRRQFAALPLPALLPEPEPEPALAAEAFAAAPKRSLRAAPVVEAPEAVPQLAQWQARVAAHLSDPAFGPTELASLLCLSERTLYRRLGELAGLTPAAWLRELRLHHARCLFEAGDFGTVVEVAEAVGFANPKYFATLYTERFGRRPSHYRR